MRVTISLAKSPSIGYRLKIEMTTDGFIYILKWARGSR